MPIIPPAIRRLIPGRSAELVAELARAERGLGIVYACSILRPPLLSGDVAAALHMLDQIEREATR